MNSLQTHSEKGVSRFRLFKRGNLLGLLSVQVLVCSYVWFVLEVTISRMATPLGTGDITGTYLFQEILWNRGKTTETVGFPTGISISDLANYEITQTLLTGFTYLFSHNIFLSVNIGFYFAHLICANLTYFISRKFGLGEGYAVLSAVAASTLPWIPGRIEHPGLWYLSISLTPLLIVRGKSESPRYLFGLLLGFLVGASGGYVVAFAFVVVLGIFIAQYKMLLSDFAMIKEYLFFALGIVIISSASLLYFGFSASSTLLDRSLQDSIHYGGYILLGLLPLGSTPFPQLIQNKITQILNQLPQTNETTWASNFGSIFLIYVVMVLLGYAAFSAIKQNKNMNFLDDYREKILAVTALTIVLFCVKGGLGPLLTATIFPPVRAWNRLIIVFQICLIILGLLVIQKMQYRLRKIATLILIPTLLLQMVANRSLVPAPRSIYFLNLQQMATDLQTSLRGDCGILQLPELKADGSGAPQNMKTYDHYLAAVVGRGVNWSFGQRLGDFETLLNMSMSKEQILNSLSKQYCAIEIDKNWTDSYLWINKLEKFQFKMIHNSDDFIVFSIT